jgi:hypothetical protein
VHFQPHSDNGQHEVAPDPVGESFQTESRDVAEQTSSGLDSDATTSAPLSEMTEAANDVQMNDGKTHESAISADPTEPKST